MSMLKQDLVVKCGKGRTKQSFRDECDVNKLMARYHKTGRLPDLIKQDPQYGDFSKPFDYQESLATVERAKYMFSQLSAKVRRRFEDNPIKMLEFVNDPRNMSEMVELGLAIKRELQNVDDKPLSGTEADKK